MFKETINLRKATELSTIIDLICDEYELYHVSLYLIIERLERKKSPVLAAASGEAGKIRLNRELPRSIDGPSLHCRVARQQTASVEHILLDDPGVFPNPILPLTRSKIALPLFDDSEVIGVLELESTEDAAFSENDILLFQPIADKIADIIQNHQREHNRKEK